MRVGPFDTLAAIVVMALVNPLVAHAENQATGCASVSWRALQASVCFANIPTVCESPRKVPIADRIRLAFDDARTDRDCGHATVSRGQSLPSVQCESKESTLSVPP